MRSAPAAGLSAQAAPRGKTPITRGEVNRFVLTWKATNKGFLPDGRLDIHVDVTGTGFGAQDANKRHWKVVVTYDC